MQPFSRFYSSPNKIGFAAYIMCLAGSQTRRGPDFPWGQTPSLFCPICGFGWRMLPPPVSQNRELINVDCTFVPLYVEQITKKDYDWNKTTYCRSTKSLLCTTDLSSKNAKNDHVFSAEISLSLYPARHNIYLQKEKWKKGYLLYAKRTQFAVIKWMIY